MVMKDGRVIEQGDVDQIFHAPKMPYTRRLLAAQPAGRQRLREKTGVNE
jgi:ABC-type dipeptide/oligopeptide/nickel transport system ATPase component